MANNIFISYRRADTEGYAGRIYDRLAEHFGDERVFMDVNDIRIGQDFVDAIGDEIIACQVVVVLIGSQWLSLRDAMGQRRLDDPHDFVRLEVGSALKRDALVVPVLLNGASMPSADELPPDLAALTRRNAYEIRHRHFENDMKTLISELTEYLTCECDDAEAATMPQRASRYRNWVWLLTILGILIFGGGFLWWRNQTHNDSEQPITASQTMLAANAVTPSETPPPIPTSETPTVTQTSSPTPLPPTSTETPSQTPTPTITETPSPTPYPTQILDAMGIQMMLVPAGTFTMGTDGYGYWDIVAHPMHEVTLPDYYIDKFEVSNSQYARCVDVGICEAPSLLGSKQRQTYYENPTYADFPVIYVSWHSAQDFCTWRGGRLPTEAEWEKAARGNDQRAYPWGDEKPNCQRTNFWPLGACEGDTVSTKSNPTGVSPYGVYNMSGNVAEWVRDWFESYPEGNLKASKEFGLSYRVVRGGAYFDGPYNIQVTVRKGLNPGAKQSYVGFRCVMDVDKIP